MEQPTDYDLLDMAATQKMLGVSRQTLHKMLKRGELVPDQVIELGQQKRRFFFRYNIDCLMAARTLPDYTTQLTPQ